MSIVLFFPYMLYACVTYNGDNKLVLVGAHVLTAFNVGFLVVLLVFCLEYRLRFRRSIPEKNGGMLIFLIFNRTACDEAFRLFFANFLSLIYVADIIVEQQEDQGMVFLFGVSIVCIVFGVMFIMDILKLATNYPWHIIQSACFKNDIEAVDLAIGYLADVNHDFNGNSPLVIAIDTGSLNIVDHLMDKGADPQMVIGGQTVLEYAEKWRPGVYAHIKARMQAEREMTALDDTIASDNQMESINF